MKRRTFIASVTAITILTLIRVAATDRIFAQVVDEPVHIAAGYGWLTEGNYRVDTEHPPLARVLAALPLWMSGISPPPPNEQWVNRGNALLLSGGRYVHNLALARAGNLLFLALAIITAALWGSYVAGEGAGVLAAILVASLPPLLAHAGVATTDMAAGATIPFALYALTLWLDSPTPRLAALLGLVIGIGLLSKFSFLLFFPAGGIVIVLFRRRRVPIAHVVIAFAIAAAIVCIGYRFGVGTFIRGIIAVQLHNARGHSAYLLGQISAKGWWYYFPVAVLFKTPLAFLILAIAALFTRARETALVALIMLAASTMASINIGVRHVLPIYVPMAVAAAIFAMSFRFKIVSAALIVWIIVNSIVAHPDYLAWFNELAGHHPERILADSNLDWGQDILRLRRACRDEHIASLTELLLTTADLDALGFPPHKKFQVAQPAHGWVAISETPLQMLGRDVLHGQPYRRVGKSIRLYYLRP